MSVYPHTARCLAEELAAKVPLGAEERQKLAAEIEKTMVEYACRASDVAGLKDPTEIARLIWYRKDGWEHGGSAMTWQDRAEELEKELLEARQVLVKISGEIKEYNES